MDNNTINGNIIKTNPTNKNGKNKKLIIVLLVLIIIIDSALFLWYFKIFSSKTETIQELGVPEAKERVENFLNTSEIKDKPIDKGYVEDLFIRYVSCQYNVYPPLIREMIVNNDLLYGLLLFNRFERWPTSTICPDTLLRACITNKVRQKYIPESFCNNICDKLSQYDNDQDLLMEEIMQNSFKNWEDESDLSKWWELRAILAWRYGGVELIRDVCLTLPEGEIRNSCSDYALNTVENYDKYYDMITDFVENVPMDERDKLNAKLLLKLDKYFITYLINQDNNYSTGLICPTILKKECDENEVRAAYIPESFCNNICDKLSQYDNDRDLMMDEIIQNSFKNWDDGNSFAKWPLLRLSIAYRYGGEGLAGEVCDYEPVEDRDECLYEVRRMLDQKSVNAINDFPCNKVKEKISDIINLE